MYDQDGEYFVAWWPDKPTVYELDAVTEGLSIDELNWILNGGGRRNYEDEWFYLREIDAG